MSSLRIAFGACLLVAVLGCSSFNRAWKNAAHDPAPTNSIEGRWEGRWLSDRNQHDGALRCIVTRQSNEVYSARFHATYRRFFNLTFGYTALLQTEPGGLPAIFSGEADLGWYAGGVYRYRGEASATNFFSTYTCKYDEGTFQMTRPAPP